MLRTKSLIWELSEVPTAWVFEHYLNLTEKLTGQSITMLSPFNPKDKVPSFSIKVSNRDDKTYVFKDFSTGLSGGGAALVERLFNLSTKGEAAHKIITDYNEFILNNKEDYSLREFKVQQKYKVIEHVRRGWTTVDQKYWTKFHIGSRLLERYNVHPLESYRMMKEEDGQVKELLIEGRHCIYGYFREDGTLYKIYQPLVQDKKFLKIREYIQGTDQLTYKTNYLVICSSLKDVMAFMKLGYPEAEAVAPDSENTLIPQHVIGAYRLKYKNVSTLFDNDDPGIEAMEKYRERYGIKGAHLKLSKDLSDSMKDHGLLKVKQELTPLLRKSLEV
jgi:hypothetical protein